jgi:hypothetical protein
MMRSSWSLLIAASLVAGFGCSAPANNDVVASCTSGKCDTPDEAEDFDIAAVCEDRRAEMLDSNRELFLEDAVRWSCADVRGVNTNNEDSRGQEYCEYWAALRPPPETDGGEYGAPLTLGRPLSSADGDVTSLSFELSDDQIYYIEDHIDEVMGSCYFSSWHNDFPTPYPACANEQECETTFEGLPYTADIFQMKLEFNANDAAYLLVQDCLAAVLNGAYDDGDPAAEDNALASDFIRGCHLADGYGVAWRKSDSSVCAATMRLGECGCATDAQATADALVPHPDTGLLRGFPLGGWASANSLPAGCEYASTGDDSQTLVRCDLTAGDVLQAQSDLKGYCKNKYADNVVVYVPVPAEALTCDAPTDNGYADTCSATPWVVTQ